MAKKIPVATHEGKLDLGGVVIPCAVLSTGQRVLSLRSTMAGLGYKGSPGVKGGVSSKSLVEYLPAGLLPFIDRSSKSDLKLLQYKPHSGGESVWGVKAEALHVVCEVILKAREAGRLRKDQENIAKQAEGLVRSFAKTGIIALVDEKTGYQEIRNRDALEQILKRYVVEEIQPWVKRFPDDYYTEIARLKGWDLEMLGKEKPSVVGQYTNDLVYARLAPGVLDALHELVPRSEVGKLEHKLHQHLTEEDGIHQLELHLTKVVTLMKASISWQGFMLNVNRVLPKFRSTRVLELDDTEGS